MILTSNSELESEGFVDPGPGSGGDVDYARRCEGRVLHGLQQGKVGRRHGGQHPQHRHRQQQHALRHRPERAAPHPGQRVPTQVQVEQGREHKHQWTCQTTTCKS